jgi:hypothetical protein
MMAFPGTTTWPRMPLNTSAPTEITFDEALKQKVYQSIWCYLVFFSRVESWT